MKSLKCVVVGDGAVGKTSILVSYTTKSVLTDYIPTIFENYNANCVVDGIIVNISLWDTAGEEDYDRLRPLSYPFTDIFLVCFSTISPTSFHNVKNKWIPELQHFTPGIPYILVGTKTDLRNNVDIISILNQRDLQPISYDDGFKLAKEIEAIRYIECSSLDNNSINNVFNDTIKAIFNNNTVRVNTRKSKRCCIL